MEIGDSIELCFYHGIERNENGYWLIGGFMEIGDSIELCFYHGIERNENGYWLNYTDYMGLVCCDEMTKEELQNLIDHYDCTLQKLFDLRDKLKNA